MVDIKSDGQTVLHAADVAELGDGKVEVMLSACRHLNDPCSLRADAGVCCSALCPTLSLRNSRQLESSEREEHMLAC